MVGRLLVIKILGSVVTQTLLGGLTIYLPVQLQLEILNCTCDKNYENWKTVECKPNCQTVEKVVAVKKGACIFGPPCKTL